MIDREDYDLSNTIPSRFTVTLVCHTETGEPRPTPEQVRAHFEVVANTYSDLGFVEITATERGQGNEKETDY